MKVKVNKLAHQLTGISAICCAVVFVAGCNNKEVLSGLTQSQAIQVVAELQKVQIPASVSKSGGGGAKFSVFVAEPDYSNAILRLHEQNLPQNNVITIEELLGAGSFLPPSQEVEQRRLDYARGLEIEELLLKIPGVREAKVMVRSNLKNIGQDGNSQVSSGVAIVLKVDRGTIISSSTVFNLIRTNLPELSPEGISLHVGEMLPDSIKKELQPTQLKLFLGIARVAREDVARLALFLLCITFAIAGAGSVLGYWFRGLRLRARTPVSGSDFLDSKSITMISGQRESQFPER
jgi:type III secretory pathway lipoprotein EscJ